MKEARMSRRLGCRWLMVAILGVLGSEGAWAQIPGLPSPPASPASASKSADTPAPAPTKDNPEAVVATTSGPIDVDKKVDDAAIRETLGDLLPQYPGVRGDTVKVRVRDGVVKLDGQVEDDGVRTKVTEFVRRVEGVRLVLNGMRTDAQVMTARQLVMKALAHFRDLVARDWLLFGLAVGVAAAFALLARLFNRYSETILAPFLQNVLLRSVVGSILGASLVIVGLLLALQILDLTQAVLSILGLAGVVGLAVGFAFRDITENFIASVLLGVRRPFRVGDYVEVAGKAGVVKSLNTRATVLVTLEGKHVRIPNAIIFKEILVNSTASPSVRATFDVLVPYEASTARAMEAITGALRAREGLLSDPPPRALVDGLDPIGVRLRAYFWTPATGVDGFKLNSDVMLGAKVALQQAGITPPPKGITLTVAGRIPVDIAGVEGDGRGVANGHAIVRQGVVTAEQARANLQHDTRAAEQAAESDGCDADRCTPMEHVLNEAETRVSDEGENLLPEPEAKGAEAEAGASP